MKIIGSRRRGSTMASPILTKPARAEPKKKALLVGINYDVIKKVAPSIKQSFNPLLTPRSDAKDMCKLLIKEYGFKREDIILMLDKPSEKRLLPTRTNVRRELAKLVEGAQRGDRFVFLFAGHSDQTVNKTGSEDDGLDEQVVTLDGKIIDNDLHELLVKPLPPGAHLTAIFDSCHSGTMLDLPHYDCNRVVVPWVSKVYQHPERSRWATVLRRNATLPRMCSFAQLANITRRSTDLSFGVVSLRMAEQSKEIKITKTNEKEQEPEPKPKRRFTLNLKRNKTKLQRKPRPLSIAVPLAQASIVAIAATSKEVAEMHKFKDALFCLSPVSSTACQGFCPITPAEDIPDVVSLSACADREIAWEGEKGQSMTRSLINYLEATPHPTYEKLYVDMSYNIYDIILEVKRWKLRQNAPQNSDTEPQLPQAVIQTFQMGSLRRMDMTEIFTL
ncbi:predicted protein [Sparassis crispa]|uniref:Peptidase C14 caspase domain-containing protein n=1 Tax=Sparassis crispa TaxID=139825 RepID=A0A401H336_9APHY|nr:predicted protein [Sparassis crispa]GBE88812.1 predicted protein [Sparassis crispa]